MITYQYQVLRYLPDRVSGEFVNLGLVIFEPTHHKLVGKFIGNYKRLNALYPDANSRFIRKTVEHLNEETKRLSRQFKTEFAWDKFKNLDLLTRTILPKDDSAIFFSEVKEGVDLSIEAALKGLFNKVVHELPNEDDNEIREDKEVWNRVYREHFEKHGITAHLSEHTVRTKSDQMKFEHAWKNGQWHCFESVSFNLKRADSIKNKVYKWAGRIQELQTSNEQLDIYLLAMMPHTHPTLNQFVKQMLNKKGEHARVHLVSESEAEKFAKGIHGEIEKHNN
jgi:hypothetical protein